MTDGNRHRVKNGQEVGATEEWGPCRTSAPASCGQGRPHLPDLLTSDVDEDSEIKNVFGKTAPLWKFNTFVGQQSMRSLSWRLPGTSALGGGVGSGLRAKPASKTSSWVGSSPWSLLSPLLGSP